MAWFQNSRQELERQQSELREMLEKLEADRNMELSERMKLEEEIAAKQVPRLFKIFYHTTRLVGIAQTLGIDYFVKNVNEVEPTILKFTINLPS